MKLINGIAFLLILFVVACNNAPDRPDPILDPSATPSTISTTTSSTVPPANTASTNSSVPHYICPNNCVGGGGSAAGPCPVCGANMTHNAAFHNQPATPSTPTPPTPGAVNTAVPTTPPAGAEPAQNANGVWHYTCTNGCPGGAGSAIACATCGTTLVHNTLYHQ